MTEKASCSVCGSYTSSIYRTGRCPNGCLGGLHLFDSGSWGGEFCGAYVRHGKGRRADDFAECTMRREDKIHTLALVNVVATHGVELLDA